MITFVDDLPPGADPPADTVIDVRSPAEFAEDHAPGAVNLPVLSDAERALVGRVYVQEDKFRARRLGAALVARNVAGHLEGALADRPGGWRPLLYCWRGGQRSGAMATVLDQVGWRVALLRGGYRSYRRGVVARLYAAGEGARWRFILLDGGTGSGKTALLAELARRGVQVLDLEALAEHRGSLLGAVPGRPQPPQKLWESRLAAALARLDPARPVVVEAESSKVGDRLVPPAVWDAMQAAPRLELVVSPEARARHLAQAYADTAADRAAFAALLGRLPRHIGRAEVDGWRALLAEGRLEALAAELIARHYDPAYARSAGSSASPAFGRVAMAEVTEPEIARAACEVIARIAAPQPS